MFVLKAADLHGRKNTYQYSLCFVKGEKFRA